MSETKRQELVTKIRSLENLVTLAHSDLLKVAGDLTAHAEELATLGRQLEELPVEPDGVSPITEDGFLRPGCRIQVAGRHGDFVVALTDGKLTVTLVGANQSLATRPISRYKVELTGLDG